MKQKLKIWWRMWLFTWKSRHLSNQEFVNACQQEVERVRQKLRAAPGSREMYEAVKILDELDELIEERYHAQ